MNKALGMIATVALGTLVALPAAAGNAHGRYGHGERSDYARVVEVVPITRIVEVREPRRECWTERVTRHERAERNHAGMLVGGILGGVVGNRFGGGDGRRIATVAGTILGAGLGDELANREARGRHYTTDERRCRTVDDLYSEERTIGYRVRYRYHGEEYVTRMDRHPGERIRVRVQVTPDE